MTYEIGSRGNIVTEQFGKELSVFSKDEGALMITHFCNSGHQSRLKLKTNKSSGVFEFEAFDLINKKHKDAAHVQRIIYKFGPKNKIDLDIVWKKGKKEKAEKYRLSRI